MLPGLDGIGLVRILRAGGIEWPVLFLTTPCSPTWSTTPCGIRGPAHGSRST
jgi:hypothetical protein